MFLLSLPLWVSCVPRAGLPPGPVEALEVEMTAPAQAKQLFGSEPVFEVLLEGLDWSEGPLVLPDGRVLCSDVPRNHVLQWSATEQGVYLNDSGGATDDYSREPGSNGLALNAAGELLLCQHGSRRVARMDAPLEAPAPTYTSLADRYQGRRFNSPNDLVVAADGSILFTDPPYGLPKDLEPELDFCGVYRVDPRGRVSLLTAEYSRPNGIGLSPDGKTLYLGNSDGKRAVVTATPILDSAFTLGAPRLLLGRHLIGKRATRTAGRTGRFP